MSNKDPVAEEDLELNPSSSVFRVLWTNSVSHFSLCLTKHEKNEPTVHNPCEPRQQRGP